MAQNTYAGVVLRRQDGLAKEWRVKKAPDGAFMRVGPRDGPFDVVHRIHALDGTSDVLLVCERRNVDWKKPFVRPIPGALRHVLLFEDILFMHTTYDGNVINFKHADMASYLSGENIKWCIQQARDVGTTVENHVNTDVSSDEEEEEEEEEEEDEEEDSDDDVTTEVTSEDDDVDMSDDVMTDDDISEDE